MLTFLRQKRHKKTSIFGPWNRQENADTTSMVFPGVFLVVFSNICQQTVPHWAPATAKLRRAVDLGSDPSKKLMPANHIPICEPWCWNMHTHICPLKTTQFCRFLSTSTMVPRCAFCSQNWGRSYHPRIGDFLPSGKRLHNYGKSPIFMGKSTINGDFPFLWISYLQQMFKIRPWPAIQRFGRSLPTTTCLASRHRFLRTSLDHDPGRCEQAFWAPMTLCNGFLKMEVVWLFALMINIIISVDIIISCYS